MRSTLLRSALLFALPLLVRSERHSSLPTSSGSTFTISTTAPSTSPSPPTLQEIWVPIQTIVNPSTEAQAPSSTASPHADLELREIVAANPPAEVLPGGITQVSPITTLLDTHWVNGVPTPVQIVYSQRFAQVPEQWAGPMSGSIGMGNIQGKIGVAKTVAARAETQTPTVEVQRLKPRSGTEAQAKASGAMFALIVAAAALMW